MLLIERCDEVFVSIQSTCACAHQIFRTCIYWLCPAHLQRPSVSPKELWLRQTNDSELSPTVEWTIHELKLRAFRRLINLGFFVFYKVFHWQDHVGLYWFLTWNAFDIRLSFDEWLKRCIKCFNCLRLGWHLGILLLSRSQSDFLLWNMLVFLLLDLTAVERVQKLRFIWDTLCYVFTRCLTCLVTVVLTKKVILCSRLYSQRRLFLFRWLTFNELDSLRFIWL